MKTRKRTMAAIAAMVMTVSSVPLTGAPLMASADGEWSKFAANTTLGTSGIGAPSNSISNTAWTGNYVYYGKYNGIDSTKYRVLDPNSTAFGGNTMLLDCDTTLYNAPFDADGTANTGASKANEWAYSDVKTGLNGDAFLNKTTNNVANFTDIEKSAIAASTKSAAATGDKADGDGKTYLNWTSLSNDKIFLLDAKEASNSSYGYSNDNTRKKSGTSSYGRWLRSPYGSLDD